MKKILVGMLVLGAMSASAYATNHSGIHCNTQKGIKLKYQIKGSKNPADDATKKLQESFSQIPEAGKASYSIFFKGYIEVSKKSLSKLTISTQSIPDMQTRDCLGYVIDNSSEEGLCLQATACITADVEYAKCIKISYDPQTGEKIVTCPGGNVIRE